MVIIAKVKTHVKKNKKTYLACATTAVVTAGATVYLFRRNVLVTNRQVQMLTYKSKQVMEVYIEALGDPGNIIQDTTTGTIYASQNQAALALDVSPAIVSQHLHGKRAHVKGHQLANLGKAIVAESESR